MQWNHISNSNIYIGGDNIGSIVGGIAGDKDRKPSRKKLSIFICHASTDKPVARELFDRLIADGFDPWLDEEKLLPGQDWDLEIEKAVGFSHAIIVCLSSKSVTKEGYIQKELRYSLDLALEKPEGSIFILPLRLDDCEVPRRIRSWQYVDFFPENRKDWAYDRLRKALLIRQDSLK